MRIALIVPKTGAEGQKSFYDYAFYSKFLLSKKYISCLLAIPTLAALTPSEHEVRVFDENLDGIDYEWPADLAALSVMTMFAPRAYEICAQYRARGIRTVLGGIHPSMLPEEALEHCDTVVIGEAEETWSTVLQDAAAGQLKRTYRAEQPADLTCSPLPDRTPLARHRYFSENVQTTKGCPFSCEFCSVHAFDGQRIRHKTVEQVVREISDVQASPSRYKRRKAVFFADDNLIADLGFARALIKALEPLEMVPPLGQSSHSLWWLGHHTQVDCRLPQRQFPPETANRPWPSHARAPAKLIIRQNLPAIRRERARQTRNASTRRVLKKTRPCDETLYEGYFFASIVDST